ncbi:succinate dehydrogenase [Rhodococcus sp. KBS0724]|uniref:succinate dehydrogenase n=1 Tax=Rhodococcus sp. KBS0724 TaxID=1179674 RepID=UPI00110EC4AD|nr:succinate dehydrogenase [Rhodococcus sp. KBS0724]TSD40202.1 succinate dehydrogenase [Rhodococcus sp. KBS0724]TSD40426.1 succinate dehydrogenase [Rhodococcus sp. KBS0724]
MSIPTTTRDLRTKANVGGNFEKLAWIFMRLSGVVLLVLVTVHVYVNLVAGEGVHKVDFAFVAGKWANPFWQLWDFAILWLAVLHGTNGVRVIIADYSTRAPVRFWMTMLICSAAVMMLIAGTFTIFTFDPCPAGILSGNLPDFCPTP